MNKIKANFIYNIFISLMSLFAVVIVIIEIITDSNSIILTYIDYFLLIVFSLDYFIRFFIAENKLKFFKENIFDLLAIIPFDSLFRILRINRILKLSKLVKFSKLTKLSRLIAYASKINKYIQKFFNTNGFKYITIITFIFIIIGALGIHIFENIPMSDAFWWSFVTTTTVGYGDISPETVYGRFTAMILMLIGIGLIGSLTSTITSFFLAKNNNINNSLESEIIESIKNKIDNIENCSDEDIDYMCNLLKSIKNSRNNKSKIFYG